MRLAINYTGRQGMRDWEQVRKVLIDKGLAERVKVKVTKAPTKKQQASKKRRELLEDDDSAMVLPPSPEAKVTETNCLRLKEAPLALQGGEGQGEQDGSAEGPRGGECILELSVGTQILKLLDQAGVQGCFTKELSHRLGIHERNAYKLTEELIKAGSIRAIKVGLGKVQVFHTLTLEKVQAFHTQTQSLP